MSFVVKREVVEVGPAVVVKLQGRLSERDPRRWQGYLEYLDLDEDRRGSAWVDCSVDEAVRLRRVTEPPAPLADVSEPVTCRLRLTRNVDLTWQLVSFELCQERKE